MNKPVTPVEQIYHHVGGRIATYRLRRGWSQEEFGRKLARPLSRGTISNIETAHDRVSVTSLVDIAQTLRITVGSLIGES